MKTKGASSLPVFDPTKTAGARLSRTASTAARTRPVARYAAANVAAEIGLSGQVQVGSELWTAEPSQGSGTIGKGDRVEVVDVKGLRLKVRKI